MGRRFSPRSAPSATATSGCACRRASQAIAGAVAETFNDIAELNQRTAQELRRVSRAVGREGRISHRVSIGPAGSWARNEAAVNQLVLDLTDPMLEVSRVLDAVARGDLSQRMAAEIDGQPLKGEYKRLADTINTMVDQLNAFASEVTRVAREVGTEGKLGGQADVRGVGGTWKDLTDSVNSMAGNLTAQVRNIAEVTTAVARGDLSQEDHGRRPGRDPRAEEHDQHDGRPAQRARRAR